jgi:predicted RNase H-like HicB family nuclease
MMSPLMIELIPDPEAGGFTARLPDIPAYGEGESEEAAIADLREAIRAYIDVFGLDDAMSRVVSPTLRPAGWELKELACA